jgi:hypothetical protein
MILIETARRAEKLSHVYLVGEGSSSKQIQRIACTNEDKELQLLLEKNLDLLPGDQIDPEVKLRWLLIKREMPVSIPPPARCGGPLISLSWINSVSPHLWNASALMTPDLVVR